ncbi:MAG: alpha-amylase family glycosyl hydrolase [Chloroflexi bacterium]|nr:alpha-amylase family glycosyl hydrolase [Chloroflexota bacterium]
MKYNLVPDEASKGLLPALALFGAIAILIMLLARGASPSESLRLARGGLKDRWWNDRVFYEIFIRSFQDSDGDGSGDIQGIIDRLDYLNDGDPSTEDDLGITGIWLMPPFEARSYHGYDVTDYYTVESDYGSVDDMRRLIAEARSRGIAVIVDMVINHTSSRHPWFLSSRLGEAEFADWYIWADEDPGYRGPWGAPAWHQAGGRFYYAVFWDGMPDLNFRNAEVTQAIYDIAAFWLTDIGVDGFRLDAIKHIIEVDKLQENTPEGRAWLAGYEAHLESVKPYNFTVGEIFNGPSFIVSRYIEEGAIDLGFDFNLADKMISAAQRGSNRDIARAHRYAVRDYPLNQFATFLTNHDQNRLSNQLSFDNGKNKVAASLLLTGPGLPFLYYGEEIGMAGAKPDERLRTPMQWDGSRFAGFTMGDSVWEPLQSAENVAAANVAAQVADPDSLLSHYRDLIHLRNSNSALRSGEFTAVDSNSRGIYAFIRHNAEQTLLVVINLSGEVVSDVTLTLAESDLLFDAPTLVYGHGVLAEPDSNSDGGFDAYTPFPHIDPYSLVVIRF